MSGIEATSPWCSEPDRAHKDFISAQTAFGAALQAAWPSSDMERKVIESYAKYAATLQEAWQAPEAARRASETYADYVRTVQAAFAPDEARRRVADAYRRYVDDLKRAWANLDTATLSPEDLGTIAQSAAWAAGIAVEVDRAQGRNE